MPRVLNVVAAGILLNGFFARVATHGVACRARSAMPSNYERLVCMVVARAAFSRRLLTMQARWSSTKREAMIVIKPDWADFEVRCETIYEAVEMVRHLRAMKSGEPPRSEEAPAATSCQPQGATPQHVVDPTLLEEQAEALIG